MPASAPLRTSIPTSAEVEDDIISDKNRTTGQLMKIVKVVKGSETRMVAVEQKDDEWARGEGPLPGGFVLAHPAHVFTPAELFSACRYVSPPRGWPQAATYYPPIKEFIEKRLRGRRVRLTEPPHFLEVERMRSAGLRENDANNNAVKVRQHLGWQIVGGFMLLELAQGGGRTDSVDQSYYHGETHWWNVTPKGLWMCAPPAHPCCTAVTARSGPSLVWRRTAEQGTAVASCLPPTSESGRWESGARSRLTRARPCGRAAP